MGGLVKALMMKADFWSFDYTDLIAQDSSATGIVNAQCAGVANGEQPINDPRITRSPEGQLREMKFTKPPIIKLLA
tara:strand:+ start:75 stop:302 length:228 start_codon:yes stop_codon:yes gene_type:complete